MGLAESMGLSASDLSAIINANKGDNDGNSTFGGGNGAFLILILVLFAAMCGGGFGGNRGGGNSGGAASDLLPYMIASNMTPASTSVTVGNDVQRGFDQQAIMANLGNITSAVSSGFANAEISRCNQQTNILEALHNNQLGLYTILNNNQNATTQNMNNLAMTLQKCCCDQQAGIESLRGTVISENCADRQVLNEGVRDISANQTASANAITNSINNGIQSIKDEICQDRLDAKDAQIQALQNQLNMASIREQTGQLINDNNNQTSRIIQDLTDKVQALAQLISPPIRPAYTVPNPYTGCCGNSYSGGCCA